MPKSKIPSHDKELLCFFTVTFITRAGIDSHIDLFQIMLLQKELCLPDQLSCIEDIKMAGLDQFDCPDACNGLYTDIRIEKYEMEPSSDFKFGLLTYCCFLLTSLLLLLLLGWTISARGSSQMRTSALLTSGDL